MRAVIRPFLVILRKRTKVIFSERNLLYTNIGISVGISIFGDAFQQLYQRSKRDSSKSWKWDIPRTLQMAGAGLVSGPFTHYWYYYLDKFFPGRSLRTVWIKLALDQFVCSPIYIALFLITTGILEGQNWEEFKQEVREKTLGLLSVEFIVWPPAQFINFFLLPPQYRVLYDNGVSLFVDSLYSYVRYDYDSKSEEDADKESAVLKCDNNEEEIKELSVSARQLENVRASSESSEVDIKQSCKMFDKVGTPTSSGSAVSDNFCYSYFSQDSSQL